MSSDAPTPSAGSLAAALMERDQALAELERARRRAVALSELAHDLASADGMAAVVRHLSAGLPGLLDCDAGAVWLWHGEQGEVRAAATAGLPQELHEALLAVSVRPQDTPELAALLTRREPLVLNRGAVTPVLEEMLKALGLQAAIGVALLSGDRLLGAVTASWSGQPLSGTALDEALHRLQGIADQGATALLKAELVDQARHLALHDGLTQLPNRLLFHRRLEAALRDNADDAQVAVLFCDLDRFKHINDELGHAAGDEVLRTVATRLTAALPAGATIGRLSGDEFAVLAPDIADHRAAVAVGQSLVDALLEPLRVEGQTRHLTISVGVALHAGSRGSPSALLRTADTAMYDAKRRGRNQVVLARALRPASRGSAPSLARELHNAGGNQELRLFLQPAFRLAAEGTHAVCGAEALVRWEHPRLGLLPPATFLSIAEDDGSIVELDHWMLRQACVEAANWPAADDTTPYLAVNLSVRTLLDEGIAEIVRTAIVASGLSPRRLHLEVVESRALQDFPVLGQRLSALRHLGVRIALDDFGTGFSTLVWLQHLPVDTIKIDRSLVADLASTAQDERGRVAGALLRGMVTVGRELGVDVLAEGVETPDQLDAVRAAGCELVQGYLFARPGPVEEVRPLLT